MRRILALSLAIAVALSLGVVACKKKEQQPVPQAPQIVPPPETAPGPQMPPVPPMQPGPQTAPGPQMPPAPQMPSGHGAGMGAPKGELKIVVPDSVKGKWSAVKIVVEDKTAKKAQEFTVKLNSEFQIPNSDLKVVVGEFLPDFRMGEGSATSASNETNNPAVRVRVIEKGKEIHKGWLYAKFPTIHPFEHPKYGLALKEGVKKG